MASNPLPTDNELIATLERFRREALRGSVPALQELTSAYEKLYTRLELLLDVALNRIWNNGGDIASQTFISRELRELMAGIEEELTRYQAYLQTVIDNEIDKSLRLGGTQSAEILRQMTGGAANLTLINFNNPGVLNTMIELLSWRSGVFAQVQKLAGYYAPLVRDIMIEAIALGYGPARTAGLIAPFLKKIKDKFKLEMARPYADALRMTRTAQLWAAREATRQNYRASDIVTGWVWWAQLDQRTCMACVALHGTVHTLDEILNDHYSGRCAMLVIIQGVNPVPDASGEKWFNSLSPAQQRQMMGPGRYEAWQAGKFAFSAMAVQKDDTTYGTMTVEATLKSLLGEG
jgi:hypothetical protein